MSFRLWSGRSFLVTRPRGQGERLADLLRSKGATVYHIPLIKIVPPTTWERLDEGLHQITIPSPLQGKRVLPHEAVLCGDPQGEKFSWVIFTSRNAVDSFVRRRAELGIDLRVVREHLCFTAIGRKTAAAMEANGLKVDWVPQTFTSEGLIESFQRLAWKNVKVLIIQAEEGRMEIGNWLTEAGAEVTTVPAYRVIPDMEGVEELRLLWKGKGEDQNPPPAFSAIAADPPATRRVEASGVDAPSPARAGTERKLMAQSEAEHCVTSRSVREDGGSRSLPPHFASHMMSELGGRDLEVASILSEIAIEPLPPGNLQQIARDCLERIRKDSAKETARLLRQRLLDAEREGKDAAEIIDLLKEYQDLVQPVLKR